MSIDAALFRRVVGSFASGVTVVTTGHQGAFHGMTASAFTSLSLQPTLVLICVDNAAETCRLLRETGTFGVNILNDNQEHLSRAFSSRSSVESYGLHGVGYRLGVLGMPLLDEAAAYLECRIARCYDGGDHSIVVGEVEAAGASETRQPLLYCRGRYRQFAALPEESAAVAAP